ncbi:MAG: hypothetical protein KJ057_06005 [Phycisphaerae bacterium]|nr:MAG: hypothetical protein F9K17_03345 [Phycisphaerae bacterium]MBE7458097.1 hypothetical protein [Planctomycetia bacterium]MCK6464438.1 hypothetical protein [Phycisphaerae bacterium]MCL4718011.1 hypothetical protein [Phycisphaerae bacterium]NUQ07727.1 hypothetical protein [Phycisphaerae bacterium]
MSDRTGPQQRTRVRRGTGIRILQHGQASTPGHATPPQGSANIERNIDRGSELNIAFNTALGAERNIECGTAALLD